MDILLSDVNDRDPEFNASATYTAHVLEVRLGISLAIASMATHVILLSRCNLNLIVISFLCLAFLTFPGLVCIVYFSILRSLRFFTVLCFK